MKPLTLWQEFQQRYSGGCGSTQCSMAQHVVLARGSIPCDILVVGEGPGDSEDSFGIPFVEGAPAGGLLKYILDRSIPAQIPEWRHQVGGVHLPQRKTRVAYSNIVCCIPRTEDGTGKKAGAPEEEQIGSCAGRLREFIGLCNPALIVAVGVIARDYLDPKNMRASKLYWKWLNIQLGGRKVHTCWILHPSYLLRQNDVTRNRLRKAAIITIADAVDECFGSKPAKTNEVDKTEEQDVPF